MGQTHISNRQLAYWAASEVARQCERLNKVAETTPEIAADILRNRIKDGNSIASYIVNASAAEVLLSKKMKEIVLLLREVEDHGTYH